MAGEILRILRTPFAPLSGIQELQYALRVPVRESRKERDAMPYKH